MWKIIKSEICYRLLAGLYREILYSQVWALVFLAIGLLLLFMAFYLLKKRRLYYK